MRALAAQSTLEFNRATGWDRTLFYSMPPAPARNQRWPFRWPIFPTLKSSSRTAKPKSPPRSFNLGSMNWGFTVRFLLIRSDGSFLNLHGGWGPARQAAALSPAVVVGILRLLPDCAAIAVEVAPQPPKGGISDGGSTRLGKRPIAA